MSNCPFCTGLVRTCLGRCLIGWVIAHCGLASLGAPLQALGQQPSGAKGPGDPQPTDPHPWIATAPPAFARLIDRGRVRIVIDDPRLEVAKKHGLTTFRFSYDYVYRYEFNGVQPATDDPSRMTGNMIAKVRLIRFDTEHSVMLESRYQPDKPWENPLLQHEFDHVSISTDPRFLKLAKDVLEQPIRVTVTWLKIQETSDAAVETAIKEGVSARITDLERLVQANYDALDRESRDGQANLSERSRFFLGLYSKAGLRRCKFPYLDSIRVPAQDSANKEVLKHYLFVD